MRSLLLLHVHLVSLMQVMRWRKKVDDFIKPQLENLHKISDKLFRVVRYCFASLCYHHQFLTKTLEPTSQIRTASIFMNIPEDSMEMAKVFTYK